jgi:multiple antibiotic resistance protein
LDLNFLIQGIIAMVLITFPPDPAKILLFNTTIAQQGKARTASALLVAGVVLGILVGAALVGGPLLSLLGINVHAFSFVGGLIIFTMGLEMLYGGAPSRAQGGDIEKRVRTEGASEEDEGLIIPLSIPLIAGPGAIVTAITIAATGDPIDGTIVAIAGAITVGIVTFGSLEWLGSLISKLSPQMTSLMVRIGGLLLATIGAQMFLGGLKNFFA